MRSIKIGTCAFAALTILVTGVADADSIPLYSTGFSGSGDLLGNGVADANYRLVVGSGFAPTYVLDDVFPEGGSSPWNDNTDAARWITPSVVLENDDFSEHAPGEYIYRTEFYLDETGFLARIFASINIEGRWSTDNAGTDIRLNMNSTGNTSDKYSRWSYFSIDASLADDYGFFKPGWNTLDFVVFNYDDVANPTGLLVEIADASAVAPVPEPASMALLGIGIVGLVARKRRM